MTVHPEPGKSLEKSVSISTPFAISLHEISEALFVSVVGRKPRNSVEDSRVAGAPDKPAVSVSWEEAQEFCDKLSALPAEESANREYRLPTEAELALFSSLHPRRFRFSYASRPLHWTVWEWCSDFRDPPYDQDMTAEDPAGPEHGDKHVARVAWSHPDPFVGVFTFRVVSVRDDS